MQIDCTLNSFAIPGFSGLEPIFGTKKPLGQSMSSREAHKNISMPFTLMRPHIVNSNSTTTGIEVNSVFDITVPGVTLTLSGAVFNECLVRVLNSSGGNATVTYGIESGKSVEVASGKSLLLEYADGWKISALTDQGLADLVQKKVDKVAGKGLSDTNYTQDEKTKLAGIANGAQVNPGVATASTDGLMSAGDKSRLDVLVPPGTIIQTFIRSAAVRAQKRLLDLSYQIISITGTYAALAANVYCGDALNATEPWFYKCDASGNRTTSGAYMRLPDPRGLFIRGAGANSVYKGANDTPYDGKSIGAYIPDAIRNIIGDTISYWADQGMSGHGGRALIWWTSDYKSSLSSGNSAGWNHFYFDASCAVPVAHENRPASISAMTCITF